MKRTLVALSVAAVISGTVLADPSQQPQIDANSAGILMLQTNLLQETIDRGTADAAITSQLISTASGLQTQVDNNTLAIIAEEAARQTLATDIVEALNGDRQRSLDDDAYLQMQIDAGSVDLTTLETTVNDNFTRWHSATNVIEDRLQESRDADAEFQAHLDNEKTDRVEKDDYMKDRMDKMHHDNTMAANAAATAAEENAAQVAAEQAVQDNNIATNAAVNDRQNAHLSAVDDDIVTLSFENARQAATLDDLDVRVSDNANRIDGLETDVKKLKGGVALAIATASQHFDLSHDGVQGSVSTGVYGGQSAMAFGLGGKLNNRTFLNANVGIDSRGTVGAGGAVNWKF